MSLNFCDLLVLGSDLSGVMAATLLAKRGMNVLVLDDENETEPLPNLLTGLGSRSFKSLLGKLMIPDTKLQMLHENQLAPPAPRIVESRPATRGRIRTHTRRPSSPPSQISFGELFAQ